jgi:hypothetical protein
MGAIPTLTYGPALFLDDLSSPALREAGLFTAIGVTAILIGCWEFRRALRRR